MKKDASDQPEVLSDTKGYNKPNNIQGINPNTWFSPLPPLPNFAPESVTGRGWDYQVGYNLQYNPRPTSNISFDMLRALANNCDIMSVIINSRKDQVESREWVIKPVDGEDVDEDDPRIKEMTEFWKKPDKINTFDQWLRPWLDDLFVIDAPTLYVQRNRIGGIYGVQNMDGSKVKILIDAMGRTPMPPNPAYQMILKGVPAIAYTTDELIYSPRNRRSYDPYGRSPVEQTMVTINTAINRAYFNRDYYIEGNIPDAVGSLSDNFTPAQAAQFTEWWDTLYSGNNAQRHKIKFVPGMDHFFQLKAPEMKNAYDDYIARILCFAMGISAQPFISQMNRATAQTAEETSEQAGQQPVETSICNVINKVIQGEKFFNYPDLEFAFETREDPDPREQADILKIYVDTGIITRNAAREKLGEDPEPGVADELCITTSQGIMKLEDADAMNKQKMEQADQTMKQGAEAHDQAMSGGGEMVRGKTPVSGSAAPQTPAKKSAGDIVPDDLKKTGSKKNFRKIHIASLERKSIVAAKEKAAKTARKYLAAAKRDVMRDIHVHGARFSKDSSDPADRISLSVDLSALEDLSTEIKPIIEEVADEAGKLTLGSLGVDEEDLVNQVYQRAVDYADSRSAELVTQITDTTRERLREIIAQGLEDNIGRQAIADQIEADQSGLFSEDRAQLIADYEVGSANGVGSLEGLEQAEEAGVEVMKEWYPDAEACPICTMNADAGPIPLDQEFPSGDDAPLAHPNCECSLLGIVTG